jgi:hypothetical protein
MKGIRMCLAGIFFCAAVFSGANAAEPEEKPTFILFKGVVIDGETGRPIPRAALYTGHIKSGVTTHLNGEYEIKVPAGTKVRFKKAGYVWQTVTVTRPEKQTIRLSASQGAISTTVEGKITEVICDGESIPEEEWPQINSEEIGNITVLKSNGTLKMLITSK